MNGATQLLGLIGWPLNYSLSPLIHNSALDALKLNFSYVPLRVDPDHIDSLKNAVLGLRAMGFRGVNVTIPYKQLIIPYLDRLSPTSMRTNSVNTVIIGDDGLLSGDSTDGSGFISDLADHGINNHALSTMRVALLGAGGCAHAIAFALLEHGCACLYIYNRGRQNADYLLSKTQKLFPGRVCLATQQDLKKVDLIVNCTPPNTISNLVFSPEQIIYDTNYMHDAINIKTCAESAKSRFISGIGMLINSGALSFELFTGVKAPIDIMKKAL